MHPAAVIPLHYLVVLVIVALSPTEAWAKRPSWTVSAPDSDSRYQYYLGVASAVRTLSQARNQAADDAYQQALGRNFGTRVQAASSSFSSERRLRSVSRVDTATPEAVLHRFERVEEYAEVDAGGQHHVWLLYRYPQEEAKRERSRLQGLMADPAAEQRWSQSGVQRAGATLVEVVTTPPNARVFVDGETVGRSPVRAWVERKAGDIVIEVDHPEYRIERRSLPFVPGVPLRETLILEAASGQLSIMTTPVQAEVFVDGERWGEAPVSRRSVPAGRSLEVEVRHSEAEPVLKRVTVGRDQSRSLRVELPLRPATLSLRVAPDGARAQFAGATLNLPAEQVSVPAGTHELLIKKAGYRPVKRMVSLAGGGSDNLGLIQLEPVPSYHHEASGGKMRWTNAFSLGYSRLASPVPAYSGDLDCISLELAQRWTNWFATRLQYSGCDPVDEEVFSADEGEIHAYELSLPLRWDRFYILANAGLLHGDLGYQREVRPALDVSETFYGAGIGAVFGGRCGESSCTTLQVELLQRQYVDEAAAEAGNGLMFRVLLGLL